MKLELENRFASVVLSVNALAEELQYTRNMLKESERVIKQLREGVRLYEPILIHPADLTDLLTTASTADFDWSDKAYAEGDPRYITVNDVKYEQSVLMPIKSKSTP